MKEELGFWVAVGLVSIVAMAFFKWGATTKLGDAVPGYRSLAGWV